MAAKNNLKLVTEEAKDIKKQFDDLFHKVNKQSPRDSDERAFRVFLDSHKDEKLWANIVAPMTAAEGYLCQIAPAGVAMGECWRRQMPELRDELGYQTATKLEQLLIRHIGLCWLRLAQAELAASAGMAHNVSIALASFHDKRLTACHKRFTRACESLVKVRRLMQRVPAFERQQNVA